MTTNNNSSGSSGSGSPMPANVLDALMKAVDPHRTDNASAEVKQEEVSREIDRAAAVRHKNN